MSTGEFGEELRRIRHQKKLKLSEVSDQTGISVPMLSRMERGERLPSDDTLERLALFYGMHPSQLAFLASQQHASARYRRSLAEEWQRPPERAAWSAGARMNHPELPDEDVPSSRLSEPAALPAPARLYAVRPISELFPDAEEPASQAVDDALQAARAALRQFVREYERAEGSLSDEDRRRLADEIARLRDGLNGLGPR